jgi:hypothetical protein
VNAKINEDEAIFKKASKAFITRKVTTISDYTTSPINEFGCLSF